MTTALAALAFAAPSAAPERLDALSFDSGALMVEEGPASREAAGLDEWSAWHVSDGDETQGCAPPRRGRPASRLAGTSTSPGRSRRSP